ncbi:class I SAM-dependent methyltransferase [Pseudofrankia asymbiotica]|nr:SAM-dependent methyltransferase [Pseudofrankia asymbiotica]
MREKPSRTAQHVALFRALESARGQPRLFTDPYAAASLPPSHRLVVAAARLPAAGPRLARRVERLIDRRWPGGPRASAVARTRLIDDLVTDALAAGARQLVLLGAGYDSRAYRLLAVRAGADPAAAGRGREAVDVYEVDHPATQARKRRLVERRVPAAARGHVRFVAADLLRVGAADVLLAAGLRPDAPAVVVWEGVTNYLDAASVDATLTGLAGALAPGSRVVFTYVDRRALDGTGTFSGVDEWAGTVRAAGEPFTFGLVPDELPGYLAARGLALTLDRSTRDAADRYLTPLGRGGEPAAPFYRVAQAEVVSRPAAAAATAETAVAAAPTRERATEAVPSAGQG